MLIVITLFLLVLCEYRNERVRRRRLEAAMAAVNHCTRSSEIYVASRTRARRVNVPVGAIPAEDSPVWCAPPRGPHFRATVRGPRMIDGLIDGLVVIDFAGELHAVSLDDVVSL